MGLAGWGSVLLGGCPLRQLILAGEGSGDSAVTVLGMIVGAAIAHNFGMAGNADAMTDGVFTAGGVALSGRFPYLKAGDVVEVEIEGLGRQRQVFAQA